MHQFDSAEQYFTRAVDFGYSFSVDETFEKWGRQEILGDYVRLIRTIRPDIVIGMRPDGSGGGQHHQASAVISREAFMAAGDPARFPEQIREAFGHGSRRSSTTRAGSGLRANRRHRRARS